MNQTKRTSSLITLILWSCLFAVISSQAYSQSDTKKIGIGILIDGEEYRTSPFVEILKEEVTAVLGASYEVSFPDEYMISIDWDAEKGKVAYEKLIQAKEVDAIITLGVLSTLTVTEAKNFPKPTMAWGVVDPITQGIHMTPEGTTNISNFTFVQTSSNLKYDLNTFKEACNISNVAIVIDEYIFNVYQERKPIDPIIKEAGLKGKVIKGKDSVSEILAEIDTSFDAVYLSHLFKLKDEQIKVLNDSLVNRGLLVYSTDGKKGVENGALIGTITEDRYNIIARRFALNFESIFDGDANAKDLPVIINYESKIVLNASVSQKLDYLPKWETIFNADWVYDQSEKQTTVSLEHVIEEAIENNLSYQASTYGTLSGDEIRRLANSALMPSIEASVGATLIDQPTASRSFGTRAERQAFANAELQQIIYSERVFANAKVQRFLQDARVAGNEQVLYDVVYQTAIAYYNLLFARTQVNITKKYLESTKRNLEIAEMRENVGYSGSSDVYRWKSNLAKAEQQLIDANIFERQQMLVMNSILNREMKESIMVKDVDLTDGIYGGLATDGMAYLVEDPISLLIVSEYIVDKALIQRPVVQQYSAQLLALERQRKADSRNRFIPEVALSGGYNRVLARGGIGSESQSLNGVEIDPLDQNWNISVVARIPLFSGFEKQRTYQKARYDQLQTQSLLDQTKVDVEREVRSAVLDLASTSTNITNSREAMEAAQKNYEIVRDNYSKGRVSIIELIDAQNNAFESEQQASNAVYQFLEASMSIQRSVGNFSLLQTDEEREQINQEITELYQNQIRK
ncbi:TolC family protein [Flammeovirga sp. SubArs3]|uniref:TolC family protein n=1 Tax=Flammeovirga sp. SubArs3 TaxID=2995316 RepID=UPI00248C1E41|nr:TolC family protein [Flammeovirga sp. SubArs3]